MFSQLFGYCLFTSIDSIEKSQEIRMQVKIFECGIFYTPARERTYKREISGNSLFVRETPAQNRGGLAGMIYKFIHFGKSYLPLDLFNKYLILKINFYLGCSHCSISHLLTVLTDTWACQNGVPQFSNKNNLYIKLFNLNL
jgi:hypothetical protein